jgi:hypothetical protein
MMTTSSFGKCFEILILFVLRNSLGFVVGRHEFLERSLLCSRAADEQGNTSEDSTRNENVEIEESTLDVIRRCMGESSLEPDGLIIQSIKEGISGFSVDPKLGFVAILTRNQRCTSCVLSPGDTLELRSPEALCMIQLAGGMDLGTAIFPPNVLEQLVADELEVPKEELRSRLELLEVHAIPNPDAKLTDHASLESTSAPPSTPERDAKILEMISKFQAAVKNLPGVLCSDDEVLKALKLHALQDGSVDRAAFSSVLDTLRRQSGSSTLQNTKIRFEIVVSLDGRELEDRIPVFNVLHALGLSLRHEIQVEISDECLEFDALDVSSRFPKFRPIQELQEDARIMDGFIPSMYARATRRDK